MTSLLALCVVARPAHATVGQFTNPVGHTADPSVAFHDGLYYSVFPIGSAISVAKSPLLETVYQPATAVTLGLSQLINLGNDYSQIWAPEIKYLDGHWYIYACALDPNGFRRMFVLKGDGQDPTTATWSPPIDLLSAFNSSFSWEIDGNVLEKYDGSLYFVFAAGVRGSLFPLRLYISPMSDPWTVSGAPVVIADPTYDWEKVEAWGGINEAPAFLYRHHRTIIVFSASGALGPAYCLGLLVNDNGKLLDPGSWHKLPTPVFQGTSSVISPGSVTFVPSPDGTQDWIVYHAKDFVRGQNLNVVPGVDANNFSDGLRRTMMQRFTWSSDDLPVFGQPIPDGQLQNRPSGELP